MARFGGRMMVKPPAAESPQKFRGWFRRYGLITVFIPALLPIPLPLKVFVISAGVLHTPFSHFLGVILSARMVRYFGEAWLGVAMGENAQGFLTSHGWTLTGIALLLALLLVGLIKFADRRRVPL
jgi:membrane protein YqaA with SNARE-associated domain